MGVFGDQARGLGVAGLHADGVGARADQRHLAAQDVYQLGQFIQAGGAQELAQTGDAVVAGCDLTAGGGVGGFLTHGAELPHHDLFLVEAVAALAKQGRALAVQPHGQADQEQNRAERDQGQRRQDDVEDALVERAPLAVHRAAQQGQGGRGQLLQRLIALSGALGVDQKRQRDGQDFQPARQGAHPRLGLGVDGQDDAVDIGRQSMVQQGVGAAQNRHSSQGVRRAGQAVVEDAQNVQVAPVQRLADQRFGVTGGADHDDVGRQVAAASPLGHQHPPDGVQAGHHHRGRNRPPAVLGHGRFAGQDQPQRAGDCSAQGGHDSDPRQMARRRPAAVKTI
uniref:LigA n=1 Tax=Parastrongyloides trichosuri TaxID=131310 RepID=A0A0N4Z3F3_PARTI